MLRLYKPIDHEIFTLHKLFTHVVKEVWCKASDDACDDKLEDDFKYIYKYSYKSTPKVKKTLKDEVERIYEIFKGLSADDKKAISDAFDTNNQIEKLCDGEAPVYLKDLPEVIEKEIKPLLVWCYETLLDKGKVAGDKMDYYGELIEENEFDYCPCCGYIPFEGPESICREAYDHYLPKSEYPFASINFQNLVPLCYKCNSDRKKAKDPIENDRQAFYPFSKGKHSLEINSDLTLDIDLATKKLTFADLEIKFDGDTARIETWDWLFAVSDRYKDRIKKFTPRFLRKIKRRHEGFVDKDTTWTIDKTLNWFLKDYQIDYFADEKFLKVAILNAIKLDEAFLQVYE
ncbi:MAG: hypothetical protein AAF502_17130 [Bacteroidota bacterium]